eukprot:7269008-Pyramimonas_sp.AAC.1
MGQPPRIIDFDGRAIEAGAKQGARSRGRGGSLPTAAGLMIRRACVAAACMSTSEPAASARRTVSIARMS